MKIYKDITKNIEISSVEEWLEHCPPMNPIKQWVEKRSAKEMAKFWMIIENQNEFFKFLRTNDEGLTFDYAVPEIATKFDNYKSPRKNDLCLFGSSNNQSVLISIEGKADERFGEKLFAQEWISSINEKAQSSNSKKLSRIIELYQRYNQKSNILQLRYQLTYWLAGSIDEAIRNKIDKVYLIVQEFQSDKTTEGKIAENQNDLHNFIDFVSKSAYRNVEPNKIIGPIRNEFTKDINLFIGKFLKDVN
jgi:hypothetical protein